MGILAHADELADALGAHSDRSAVWADGRSARCQRQMSAPHRWFRTGTGIRHLASYCDEWRWGLCAER